MLESTKYVIISTVIGGAYILGYLIWQMLKIRLGIQEALALVGKISVWGMGVLIFLLTVGSIVWYAIMSVSQSISQVL